MTIELQEGRYFESFYFMGCEGWDVHGALYKDRGGPWTVHYRFRYYEGADPDDARDRKNWYRWKAGSDDAAEIPILHGIMREMVEETPPEIIVVPFTRIDVQTDDPNAVMQKLLAQPWAHVVGVPEGSA